MPTAPARTTDRGVRVPELPEPPAELADLIGDGRLVSDPPLRDDIFPPGETGGRLVVATIGEPKTFNVIVANEQSSNDVISRMWAGLLSYNNQTQEVIPGLAHAWEVDETGTVWTAHLRTGLVFSDGSPLTSEAVDRFFRVIYTEGLVNPSSDILQINGEPFTWETPDPLTVVIRTPSIFSAMELQLTGITPLPPEPWETALASDDPAAALAQLHTLDTEPAAYVCSGPFLLRSFTSGETTVLDRNPNFQMWDASGRRLPNLDEVVFVNVPDLNAMRLRFVAGESDVLTRIMPQQYAAVRDGAAEASYTVWDLGPTLSRSFFWFNLKDGTDETTGEPFVDPAKLAWFQNPDFRRACSHALDRESIAEIVYSGRAVPKISFESVSNLYWCNREATRFPYDPDRAAALLESIDMIDRDGDGIREDADGNPIRFTMFTNRENDERTRVAVLIQEDLLAVGIDMTPSNIDFNALVEKTGDTYRYEACLLGLGGGTPDPTTGLNVLRSVGRTHLWNPSQDTPATEAEARIDALSDQLVGTIDQEEQRDIYYEIQDILGRECFMIYTIDYNMYLGTRDHIANWNPAVVDHKALWNVDSLWELTAD
jgi:peptide/nickel transport system substrate-binding protein